MTQQSAVRWEQDADGVVVLTLDDPTQSANTMNELYVRSMGETLDRLEAERDGITGVVITSGKKMFFAGGDLTLLQQARKDDAAEFFANTERTKSQLRRLETLGRPVVAAINGAAMGGGLEITLACHHRIAVDDRSVQLGLPEVTLGLLPGGGGVTRTVRMLGLQNALMQVLLQGQRLRPAAAKDIGLIDEVVATQADLVPAAKAWIAANPGAVQPWDTKGYRIPGGDPSSPKVAQVLPAFTANLRKQLKGAPMPAPHHILCAAVEGAQVDIDSALRIETRYFVDLATGQTAKNMIQAFFFDLQAITKGSGRPAGIPAYTPRKVAVLGAGMMGAGIAYVCARAGMDVLLKDVSAEAAERGKGYADKILSRDVEKGRATPAKRDEVLARITPTDQASDLVGVDLVIEAVFESQQLKHTVFQEIEGIVEPDALLASNTSTLPITGLAEGVKAQENFIGLHFFSPVDKMPLVEIIRGERTSDEALARAYDIVLAIKKTPIVVNDSRGFFTSRVIGTFLNEAVAMVGEGVPPASIEQAGLQAGYPAGPLQLMDELTLTLPRKIREETKAAFEAAGGTWAGHPSEGVVDRMVVEFERGGRSTGAGFYDYADGKRTRLWPGLAENFGTAEHVGTAANVPPFRDLQERMLFAEALETVKCFDEGVLTSAADANIGSIFGIGFPAWTGGVAQYIDGYEAPGEDGMEDGRGVPAFVARARELATEYGERFTPPASLVAKVERGEPFRTA